VHYILGFWEMELKRTSWIAEFFSSVRRAPAEKFALAVVFRKTTF
jgi:hypothetical protein